MNSLTILYKISYYLNLLLISYIAKIKSNNLISIEI